MTTPICAHIRKLLETMGNAVIDLLLVGIGLRIRLTDTLGNNAGIALRVTSVLAIFALHTSRILEELAT